MKSMKGMKENPMDRFALDEFHGLGQSYFLS